MQIQAEVDEKDDMLFPKELNQDNYDITDFKVEFPKEDFNLPLHPQERDIQNKVRVGRAQRLLWRKPTDQDVQHPPVRESSYSVERYSFAIKI